MKAPANPRLWTAREQEQAREIDRLRQQIDDLKMQFTELQNELAAKVPPLLGIGLTRSERVVAGLFLTRNILRRDTIFQALYAERPDGGPESVVVNAFVCRVRAKMRKLEVEIETIWGVGWRIPEEGRQKLIELAKSAQGVNHGLQTGDR